MKSWPEDLRAREEEVSGEPLPRVSTAFPNATARPWMVTQTLLGSTSATGESIDMNRRQIYGGDRKFPERLVAHLNPFMNRWTPEDEDNCNLILAAVTAYEVSLPLVATRERQFAKCRAQRDAMIGALKEAREIIDDLLDSEIDNNTTEPGDLHSREYKREHVVIDEAGGRDIPVFEAALAKIDAALAAGETGPAQENPT